MPRDTRNSLHIYYKEGKQEIHKIVYPKTIYGKKVNWREFSYKQAYELYNQGWTEVCKLFNVLVPDDLPCRVRWCWDSIAVPSYSDILSIEDRNKIESSDERLLYKDLYVQSHIRECTDSMFNDSYESLLRACKNEYGTERTHRIPVTEGDNYKSYFDLTYLFYEMLGNQGSNLKWCGAWILRDGSFIVVDTAQHCRLLHEYMGYKEWDMERYWVKVSIGTAHIHDRLTNQQWETINKFKKKYNITLEKLGDW